MVYMSPTEIAGIVGGINGVIHVGAHLAEEHGPYCDAGIQKRVWIEANPTLASKISDTFSQSSNDLVICATITDKDDEDVVLNISNNEQCSSVLNRMSSPKHYHDIIYVDKHVSKSKTLSTILGQIPNSEMYDMINLDIQGIELKAIKGLGAKLKQFKVVYTEVNNQEFLYEGTDLVNEIDEYLVINGFSKHGEKIFDTGWGDALYIKWF